jgi:hypothetical protein
MPKKTPGEMKIIMAYAQKLMKEGHSRGEAFKKAWSKYK